MLLAIVALLISLATGYAVLGWFWPHAQVLSPVGVLRLSLAGGVGLLLSSVLYLACLGLGIADRPWVIMIDLAVLVGVWVMARRRNVPELDVEQGDRDSGSGPHFRKLDWFLSFGLVSALMANVAMWILRFGDRPLGFWDAFAIWNLKARFFYMESGEHWLRGFSDTISWSHTDYPLLLPTSVARLWTYAGATDQAIPALLGACFALLIGALLFGAVASEQGRTMGFMAAFALLATPAFMDQVAWQLADIPMSLFLAAALVLVVGSQRPGNADFPWLVLAGVSAGAAAWTKNEGLLFALAIALGLVTADVIQATRRTRKTGEATKVPVIPNVMKRASFFVIGLALPLGVLMVMKLAVGGENDLATDFTVNSLGRIFEVARHEQILISFAQTLLILTQAPLLVLLVAFWLWTLVRKRVGEGGWILPGVIALGLQLSGYYFVYLVTERDLAWHLDTSNLRLFVQLWPSLLLLLFIGSPRLEDGIGEGP